MKSIETLIKLHTQTLDEKRRELVALQEQQEQLQRWAREMEADFRREQEFVLSNPGMAMTFEAYRAMILERQENIAEAQSNLDMQIAIAQDEMAELFTEVKKYEVVLQQKLLAALKVQKAKDTKFLDELAVMNYLREE